MSNDDLIKDKKFICPEHGEVKPTSLGYSYPMAGRCPFCEKWLYDENAEPIMKPVSMEEALLKRPGYVFPKDKE